MNRPRPIKPTGSCSTERPVECIAEVEKPTIVAHRRWAVEDLRCTDETVYPDGLAEMLERAL